jgi:hypothetical protein
MTKQPEALRLADQLEKWWPDERGDLMKAAAELRRLHKHELANNVWNEKTEWVQQTAQPHELGMHRADVLRQQIDRLHSINAQLLKALNAMLTHMGMDEDEWSKPTFDQARAAIAAAKEKA